MCLRVLTFFFFILSSCNNSDGGNGNNRNSSKPENIDAGNVKDNRKPLMDALVKRWLTIDMLGKSHAEFQKALTKAKAKGNYSNGLEFTKEGKCNLYENGVLTKRIEYYLAPDRNSILLSEPTIREKMTFKIVHLSTDKFVFVASLAKRDTIVMVPYN